MSKVPISIVMIWYVSSSEYEYIGATPLFKVHSSRSGSLEETNVIPSTFKDAISTVSSKLRIRSLLFRSKVYSSSDGRTKSSKNMSTRFACSGSIATTSLQLISCMVWLVKLT